MLLTICSFFAFGLWAQGGTQAKEKIAAKRVAFYNQELQLTAEESKEFWALYNEFEREKEAMKKEFVRNNKVELMSDTEMEQFLDDRFDMEIKQVELKRSYFNKLKDVISIRKIAMLNRVETRFKRKLLQESRRRN